MNRKIKIGMIGGGPGAFIGAVHRMALALDQKLELTAGCFSRDLNKSKLTGQELGLEPNRVYASFQELIQSEANLPDDKKIDAVAIVTPNHMHFEPAKLALENGFHVICDKPVTFNSQEAKDLQSLVKQKKLIFALTHNYTGYPMVKQAKAMILKNKIGIIRKVVVEYPQGWLANRLESDGQKQASWRTNPKEAGISCCIGDIGSHAENLAEYITGLKISQICADLTTFVDDRTLDDDGSILLRFQNGAKGVLMASQISIGEENNLSIRVYGEKGGLEWHQKEPNTLLVKISDKPIQIFRTGVNYEYLDEKALAHTRLPAGHPEGYLEAFANIYKNFALAILHDKYGTPFYSELYDFPTIEDGVRGIQFIEKAVESSNSNQKWLNL